MGRDGRESGVVFHLADGCNDNFVAPVYNLDGSSQLITANKTTSFAREMLTSADDPVKVTDSGPAQLSTLNRIC